MKVCIHNSYNSIQYPHTFWFFKVTADDSCKSIAADIGATSDDIEQWNQDFFENFNCDDISAGQLLCVDVRLIEFTIDLLTNY